MITLAAALGGLVAGLVHVVSGADHLAAMAPLAAVRRRGAWRAGAEWGLGHAAGVAIVAAAAFALRAVVSIEGLSSWGERLVGAVLVLIGAWAVVGALRTARGARDPRGARPPAHSSRAAPLVGLLHGAAGGSHVVGVLPALALPSPPAALGYLAGFGAGAIAAMVLYAWIVGSASARFACSGPRAGALMLGACGLASVLVGIPWLLRG